VVIFIDDDVVLCEGFVRHHAANYLDQGIAAVAGRIIQPRPGRYRRRRWNRLFDYRYFDVGGTEKRADGVAVFGGGNHSVRKDVMLELGGYDENFIGWAFREDSDAAIRLWRAGRRIVFDPTARLDHLAVPTGGCRLVPGQRPLPEWMVSFPAHYFAFRHQFPRPAFWVETFVTNLRRYALRKQIVSRPWRLPWALCSYFMAGAHAMVLALRKISSVPPSRDRRPE
jgi:hypothetical protein